MSAPDTNTEKQAKRHRPALIGIAIAVAVGVICAVIITIFSFSAPREAAQGGTAQAVSSEPAQSEDSEGTDE